MSGDAMFVTRTVLQVPAQRSFTELRRDLESLGGELMVDLSNADEPADRRS
jgi:glycine cleavage system regulatory protein